MASAIDIPNGYVYLVWHICKVKRML